MGRRVDLTEMSNGKAYQVVGFTDGATEYTEKLHKMGFVAGTPIELAPVELSDPMVFQIRGSRIALRKKEAKQVLVEEF